MQHALQDMCQNIRKLVLMINEHRNPMFNGAKLISYESSGEQGNH
tara:strand:+ start:912 stop:1046 length:135 start_codon:yes stop_codon:yes gene_type:complete